MNDLNMNDLVRRVDAVYALLENLDANSHKFENKWLNTVVRTFINNDIETIMKLPSVQPEWNDLKVACLLADVFGETCACNLNGNDEWLPDKCDYADTVCPNPGGVACWEQFLKHREKK